MAEEVVKSLEKETIIVVAGYPKDSIEELNSIGINNFIHVKSNVLEELEKYQNEVGIV